MNPEKFFPWIDVKKSGQGYTASAAFALKSILHGKLLVSEINKKADSLKDIAPESLHFLRESFLRAISAWPPHVSLEIRLSALPNLSNRQSGRIYCSLILSCRAGRRRMAVSELMSRYLALVPVISAHMPEAEFDPVDNEKDWGRFVLPFKPSCASAVCRRVEDIELSSPFDKVNIGFEKDIARKAQDNSLVRHLYPWSPSLDDWSKLLVVMLGQNDPVQVLIRVRAHQSDNEYRKSLMEKLLLCENFLGRTKENNAVSKEQVSLISNVILARLGSLAGACFQTGVYILSSLPVDDSVPQVLGNSISGDLAGVNRAGALKGGFRIAPASVKQALSGEYIDPEPFSVTECACAFRLPSPPIKDLVGIPVKKSRTAPAVVDGDLDKDGSIELFVNVHANKPQPIRISTEDRMRHTFIIGQTGSGKSTLMEYMIMQDIRAGRGIAVIDPHGDMVDSIIGKIPREREKDVLVFDVLDRARPVGFNILEWRTIEDRDLIIDDLYNTLDHIYDMKMTGGPIFESNFRGMLKLLMGDSPDSDFTATLLDFMSCYQDKEFRSWLGRRASDHVSRDFLKELEKTMGDAHINNLSPYITSKFSRFINDTTLKHIVGQEKTAIDFDDIMNNGKIFLVKLGKGRFGPSVCALLANQLVSRFKYAAMRRGEMEPESRREFFLYVDECHNIPSENFIELLAEARKFKLGMVLANQYTSQLTGRGGRNNLLAAILGNVGTLILFRVGHEDAMMLEPVVHPRFSATDITNLPNWTGYCRLQARSFTEPFSFRSIRDAAPYSRQGAKYVRSVSSETYGSDVGQVRKNISERRQMVKVKMFADDNIIRDKYDFDRSKIKAPLFDGDDPNTGPALKKDAEDVILGGI